MIGKIYLDKCRNEIYEIVQILCEGKYKDVMVKYVTFFDNKFMYFIQIKRLNTFYKKVKYGRNFDFKEINKRKLNIFLKEINYYDGNYEKIGIYSLDWPKIKI